MIEKGKVNEGDLLLDKRTNKVGVVIRVERFHPQLLGPDMIYVDFRDGCECKRIAISSFERDFDMVATDHPTISSLSISEAFDEMMREYENKKEKEKMKTGFTIKAINSIDEELEVVRDLIGRPLMVDYIGEHSLRVKLPEQKRTYEFSRNEVDKI